MRRQKLTIFIIFKIFLLWAIRVVILMAGNRKSIADKRKYGDYWQI
jgi:hypothetical protein